MAKIESLTPEQIARQPHYVEKWTKIGLSTDPVNEEEAKKAICLAYEKADCKPPQIIVFADSPISGAISLAHMIANNGKFAKRPTDDQLEKAKHFLPLAKLVGPSVRRTLEVYYEALPGEIVPNTEDEVLAYYASTKDMLSDVLYGNHEVGYLAFYDYFREECGLVEETDKIMGLMAVAQNIGWWYAGHDVAIAQRRPTAIRLRNGQLHSETKKAVEYADGWGFYSLNGVRVPAWIIETPRHKLDPKKILRIENVDIRREAVRLIGVEQLIMKLGGKTIDSKTIVCGQQKNEYEVIEVDLGANRSSESVESITGIYLKMKNPSLDGVWHVEAVRPECRTVEEALKFRNQQVLANRKIDAVNGADWFQQGDVLIAPYGDGPIKPYPIILT